MTPDGKVKRGAFPSWRDRFHLEETTHIRTEVFHHIKGMSQVNFVFMRCSDPRKYPHYLVLSFILFLLICEKTILVYCIFYAFNHCRQFASRGRTSAGNISPWINIVTGVLSCYWLFNFLLLSTRHPSTHHDLFSFALLPICKLICRLVNNKTSHICCLKSRIVFCHIFICLNW